MSEHGESAENPGGTDPAVPDAAETRTARGLVAAQFALIGVLVLLPGRADWPVPAGLRVLCLVGASLGVVVMVLAGTALGRGLTAVPLPNRHAVLRTGGLYRAVRHPIYTGLLLTTGSFMVASASLPRLAAFVALLALLGVKARWEEVRLARRFAAYPQYAASTPRFVPGLRPRR